VTFSQQVVDAVLAHMNDDHTDDSLLIVRAFALPGAVDATMSGLDEDGGLWSATTVDGTEEVRVAWPAGRITERAEIRREVVALYDAACVQLGVEPRAH
jgi:hypothetical protein